MARATYGQLCVHTTRFSIADMVRVGLGLGLELGLWYSHTADGVHHT